MRGPALTVLVLLLAGCSGAPTEPEVPEDEPRRSSDPDEDTQGLEAQACQGRMVFGAFPSTMVQPVLPAGHQAGGYLTDEVAQLSVAVLDCPQVLLDGNASSALRLALIVAGTTAGEDYLLELFLDGAEGDPVHAALAARGWEPRRAAITLEDRAFHVDSEDGIVYDGLAPLPAPAPRDPSGLTHTATVVHQDAAGVVHRGSLTWDTSTPVIDSAPSTVAASGGALATFAASNGVPYSGLGQSLSTDLRFLFAGDATAATQALLA